MLKPTEISGLKTRPPQCSPLETKCLVQRLRFLMISQDVANVYDVEAAAVQAVVFFASLFALKTKPKTLRSSWKFSVLFYVDFGSSFILAEQFRELLERFLDRLLSKAWPALLFRSTTNKSTTSWIRTTRTAKAIELVLWAVVLVVFLVLVKMEPCCSYGRFVWALFSERSAVSTDEHVLSVPDWDVSTKLETIETIENL